MKIRIQLFVILIFFFCSIARGYWDGFGPYRGGEEPPAFPYQIMKDISPKLKGDEPPVWKYLSKNNFVVRYSEVDNPNDEYGVVSLTGPKGSVLARVIGLAEPNWGFVALESDFNGDGEPDFAVLMGDGGNGLAAEFGQWVFFLSKGNKYATAVLDTDSIGINDLVERGKGDCLRIIHTSMIWAPPEVHVEGDGELLFRVYRLLKVQGTKIVPDQASDKKFPRIVAYMRWSEQKNHKETKLLNANQKKELLKKNPIHLLQGNEVLEVKTK